MTTYVPSEAEVEAAGRAGAEVLGMDWDDMDREERAEAAVYHRMVLIAAHAVTHTERCGAAPPNVGGPVPCALAKGHDEHLSTSGCAGSEIRWTVASTPREDVVEQITALVDEWERGDRAIKESAHQGRVAHFERYGTLDPGPFVYEPDHFITSTRAILTGFTPSADMAAALADAIESTRDLDYDPSQEGWVCGQHGTPECAEGECSGLPWPEPNASLVLSAFQSWADSEFTRVVRPYDESEHPGREMPDEAFRTYSVWEWPIGDALAALHDDTATPTAPTTDGDPT